jgi:hypothetical protein
VEAPNRDQEALRSSGPLSARSSKHAVGLLWRQSLNRQRVDSIGPEHSGFDYDSGNAYAIENVPWKGLAFCWLSTR